MMLANCLLSYSIAVKGDFKLGFADILLEKTIKVNLNRLEQEIYRKATAVLRV